MENTKKLEIQSKKYKGESVVVTSRVPIELARKIDEVSQKTDRTRNEIVIMCLEYALNNIVIRDEREG